MTVEELKLYDRLDDEIYERAEEICESLDLLHKAMVEPRLGIEEVRLAILDYENDEVDSLSLTYEQFCDSDYIRISKQVRENYEIQRKLAAKQAAKQQKEHEKEKRRRQYEKLKTEFEKEEVLNGENSRTRAIW